MAFALYVQWEAEKLRTLFSALILWDNEAYKSIWWLYNQHVNDKIGYKYMREKAWNDRKQDLFRSFIDGSPLSGPCWRSPLTIVSGLFWRGITRYATSPWSGGSSRLSSDSLPIKLPPLEVTKTREFWELQQGFNTGLATQWLQSILGRPGCDYDRLFLPLSPKRVYERRKLRLGTN